MNLKNLNKTQSTELNVQAIMSTITQKSFRPAMRPASAAKDPKGYWPLQEV